MLLLPGTALVRWLLLVLLTLPLGFSSGPAMGQAIVEIDASPIGGTNVRPTAINSAGDVIGSFVTSRGVRHAFVWADGVMLDIETDPNAVSIALGINDAGVVVGQTTDTDGDTIAFRRSTLEPMAPITVFDGRSIAGRESVATDVNNDDVIVGYARAPTVFGLNDRAFLLNFPGQGNQLRSLGGVISRAFGINDRGDIAGQAEGGFPNLVNKAAFWSAPPAQTPNHLGTPVHLDSATSSAVDLNNLGAAVGSQFTGSSNVPTLWRLDPIGDPVETRLALLPGHRQGSARSIRNQANASGPLEIVGFTSDAVGFGRPNEIRAVRWRVAPDGTHTVEALDDLLPDNSGWVLGSASGINERGEIVGTGTLDSNPAGFLLDPNGSEPEPELPPAVLFLHGAPASFLFEGNPAEKVWPAFFDDQAKALGVMKDGVPRLDVYPMEQELIKKLRVIVDIDVYGTFIEFLKGLATDGKINDWYGWAYDWRLAWDRIVDAGSLYSHKCFVETQEPNLPLTPMTCADCNNPKVGGGKCIELAQKVLDLAEVDNDVPKRKVWIVAHSNGGMVTKTLLLRKSELQKFIAGVILVGSPQLGTPKGFNPLLHGTEFNLFLVRQSVLRKSVLQMPGAYQLMPSPRYFDAVPDELKTVFFIGPTRNAELQESIEMYGNTITDSNAMRDFVLGKDRIEPGNPQDTSRPAVVDPNLFGEAWKLHEDLSQFDPGTLPFPVYQIVGWGPWTPRAVSYQGGSPSGIRSSTSYTCEGDETVVIFSATALQVPTFYVDLRSIARRFLESNANHGRMMNIPEIGDLIERIIEGEKTGQELIEGLEDVSLTKPVPPGGTCRGFITRVRSPAEIHLFQGGLHTGPVPTEGGEGFPIAEESIPNSQYNRLGEGVEALTDEVGTYHVLIEGTGVGTATLEGAQLVGNDEQEVFEIQGVPILKGSRIEYVLDPMEEQAPEITMDIEGDGTPDFVLSPDTPVATEVFLAVLRSAVEKLDADTAAVGFSEKTERRLRHGALRKALRALNEASEEQERGRTDEVVEELERVEKSLKRYQERLRREVERGRAQKDAAEPLLEEASQINDLAATSIARIGPVDDDRDDDDSDDDDRDDDDSDDDDRGDDGQDRDDD